MNICAFVGVLIK